MAALMSCCRVKLFVKDAPVSHFQRLWHTINYNNCKTVNSVVQNICEILRLDCNERELFMQNIIVPKWETSAHVFRDNDEVELRCSANLHSGTSFLSVTNQDESMHNFHEDSALPYSGHKRGGAECEMKKKKKRRKSKREEKECDVDDCQPPTDSLLSEEPVHQLLKRSTQQNEYPDNLKLDAGQPTNMQEDCQSSTAASTDTERKTAKKLERSTQLTPVEQQLIAEMDRLPKPKRRRKHKRKKSSKLVESVLGTDTKSERTHLTSPLPLNSSYQGCKKVFNSDDEKAEAVVLNNCADVGACVVGEIVGAVSEANESTGGTKDESSSSVRVTARVTGCSSTSLLPAATAAPTNTLNSAKNVHIKSTTSALTDPGRTTQPAGVNGGVRHDRPVVYKREKLKLRATISPAILDHLKSSTGASQLQEVKSLDGPKGHTTHMASPATAKKGFQRHQNIVNSTPNRHQINESQLNDEQTNLSSTHVCGISPAIPDVSETPSTVQGASDTQPVDHTPKDYSAFPDLDGPPRKGDKLAFKRLEISADYTPVVSGYKEGLVISYEPKSTMVHVKNISEARAQNVKRSGLFDVHIEGENETLTNVDDDLSQLVDLLSTFLEAKLLPSSGSS